MNVEQELGSSEWEERSLDGIQTWERRLSQGDVKVINYGPPGREFAWYANATTKHSRALGSEPTLGRAKAKAMLLYLTLIREHGT